MYKQGEGGCYGAQAKRGGNVMILLIDNYDSFSYNLFQLVGTINEDIKVIRNDEMSVDEIKGLAPSHIILSPGPKRPKDAGVCIDVVKELGSEMKILGVCLGHQSICEAYGGVVGYAKILCTASKAGVRLITRLSFLKACQTRLTLQDIIRFRQMRRRCPIA